MPMPSYTILTLHASPARSLTEFAVDGKLAYCFGLNSYAGKLANTARSVTAYRRETADRRNGTSAYLRLQTPIPNTLILTFFELPHVFNGFRF
jgi:hypothetical protein